MGAVEGFIPSASGFRFPNSFPHVPVRRIGIPGMLSVPIGDASNGLCGGMVFAARDYFEAGRTPPPDTTPPGDGPLFDFLVDRLFDSFCLPLGPGRYLALMSPLLPDGETFWTRIGFGVHGRSWQMVRDEWPKIRADVDAGHPSPIGLVTVKSSDPFDLKEDHQVLVYRLRPRREARSRCASTTRTSRDATTSRSASTRGIRPGRRRWPSRRADLRSSPSSASRTRPRRLREAVAAAEPA